MQVFFVARLKNDKKTIILVFSFRCVNSFCVRDCTLWNALREWEPFLPLIITHTTMPLKQFNFLTYKLLSCVRVLMVDGYQSETASPVPVLCIPADVWHKTFDFSLFTLTQMAVGDHTEWRWDDDMLPSYLKDWMSKQSGTRHGSYWRVSA